MMMRFVALVALLAPADAFSSGKLSHSTVRSRSSTRLEAQTSRAEFLQQAAAFGGLVVVGSSPPVRADDDAPITVSEPTTVSAPRRVAECKARKGGKTGNCVSSSSVKQVDNYVAPWTFDVSAAEAQAKLKAVFKAQPDLYKDLEEEPNYLRLKASRGLVFDELEFVFDEQDKLVKIRSAELSEDAGVSDFGANRRRLEGIRKDAQVFDIMGGTGYDSVEMRGSGPVGQLKAFYGLQSGQGFEDVFE